MMDRINGARTVDIGGNKRGFRSQNRAAGLDGTEVTAQWLNDLQETLATTIESHGIALAPGVWTLLDQVIRLSATTDRAGRVELATLAEVLARTRSDLAVTPEGLANFVAQNAYVGNRKQIFATAGAYTFTVPANVFVLDVELWGAGGGGGGVGSSGAVSAASGGASGGYGRKRLGVSPGQQIGLTVGAGGAAGASGGGNGGNGGSSGFAGIVSAVGGSAGSGSQNGFAPVAGQGGGVSGADIAIAGRTGQLGIPVGGSGAIGGFGGGAFCSSPTGPNTADGQTGAFPGGGGSGGAVTNGGASGGAGASGCIIVSY